MKSCQKISHTIRLYFLSTDDIGVSKQSEWGKIKREKGVLVFAMLMLFCSTDDREYAARDVF